MKGYCGKVLLVDLTTHTWKIEYFDDEFYQTYLSGVGLAAYLLHKLIPVGADPLGPENVLVFTSGLLTGSGAIFSERWLAVTKSPLTGTWGEANGGGNFAPAIKQCGYDAIFLQGASKTPVYLEINQASVIFHNANAIWGKDVEYTEEWLMTHTKSKRLISTVSIGKAGENLSLISGIVNDKARIAARSGVGAVMGSKKLKAIVLAGSLPIHACYDPKEVKRLSTVATRYILNLGPLLPEKIVTLTGKLLQLSWGRAITDKLMNLIGGILVPSIYKKWGTSGLNKMSTYWGDAPIKNWKGSVKDFHGESLKKISPNKVIANQEHRYHCYSCPLGCGGVCEITGYKPKKVHKPEFESIFALGGMLLIDDLDFIFELNYVLNIAGMDTISAGGTIAFAMECFENGLIDIKDTGGLDLTWGNQETVWQLAHQMIERTGFGAVLADGSKVAAKKIGQNAKDFAIHAGGQELAMHDARLDPGFGLHASVDPNPGKHTMGSYLFYHFFRLHTRLNEPIKIPWIEKPLSSMEASEENAIKSVLTSQFFQLINACGVCKFGAFLGVDRLQIFDYLNAVTGWKKTPEDYMKIGHRIQTLRQLFNIREGVNPWDMKINLRAAGQPPLNEGPNKDRQYDIDALMRNYWKEIGWSEETGIPLKSTIDALGLSEFAINQ